MIVLPTVPASTSISLSMLFNLLPLVAAFTTPPLSAWGSSGSVACASIPCARASIFADADDDWVEEEPVTLLDERDEKTLSCYVAGNIESGGVIFSALYPANAPVSLAAMEGGKLMPLEADMEDKAFPLAKAACAALRPPVELIDSAVVLTATGDWLGMEEEEDPASDSSEDDLGDLDDDDEEVLVVTSFDGPTGAEVFVVRTLDPLYVIGKSVGETSYTVPSDEELDAVGPLIEKLVEEVEMAFDAEEDLE